MSAAWHFWRNWALRSSRSDQTLKQCSGMIPHLREVEYPERDASHPLAQWWNRMRGLLDQAPHPSRY
ncbi:hypothetical protein ACO7_110013 [Thiomonas arsenitoxydans]|nr:hypothetical protein ACO7_110013 [Thiomonas arsenitoxydans]